MKMRCRLGLHKWVLLGQTGFFLNSVWQCQFCRAGRHEVVRGEGIVRYTAAAMDQAWEEGKIDNPEAHIQIYGGGP